jgi:hypothetical protein
VRKYQLKKTLSPHGKRIGRPPKIQTAPDTTPTASNPPQSPTPPATAAAPGNPPPETKDDTSIFGNPPANAPETPANAPGAASATTSQNGDEMPPQTNLGANSEKEQHRPLATVIFDTTTNLLASFVGTFWLPKPKGDNIAAGELPFDEREMVVSAVIDYFDSVGMKILTPLQKLWLAIVAYSMPRLAQTVVWIKNRRKKTAGTPPPPTGSENDPRTAKTETTPPPAVQKSDAQQPPPGNAYEKAIEHVE